MRVVHYRAYVTQSVITRELYRRPQIVPKHLCYGHKGYGLSRYNRTSRFSSAI